MSLSVCAVQHFELTIKDWLSEAPSRLSARRTAKSAAISARATETTAIANGKRYEIGGAELRSFFELSNKSQKLRNLNDMSEQNKAKKAAWADRGDSGSSTRQIGTRRAARQGDVGRWQSHPE